MRTVVGRDAAIEVALSTLTDGGRLLIEGPAGIGKSTLLQALLERAEAQGTVVVRCAPTETEAALPLAAVADLLRPLQGDLEDLPPPQREAARSALLLDATTTPLDERALASAVRTVLDAVAQRTPAGVVVAVDDAPWLDPPSERALRFALRRCSSAVTVVVVRRSGDLVDAQVPLELDARSPVERLPLTPLGVGPLHRLLADRFDVSLSRPLLGRLARESGGNPLLALEMTRALLRLPHLPGPTDDLPVPGSMHELVEASLGTLGTDSVRAVRLASLLSAPRLADLAAAGVGAEDLDAVEAVGLLVVDGNGGVAFAHPVYASAVRAGIPAGLRRRLHALLAEASTDADERARHLARGGVGPDEGVADELEAAAGRARARGAPELAAELYDQAAVRAAGPDRAARLRLRALHHLFDSGDYAAAADRVDALVPTVHGDVLAEALLLRAAIAFAADDLPLAATTGRRALEAAMPGSRLAGRVHAHLAVFVDAPEPARAHAETALVLLSDPAADPADGEATGPGVLGRSDDALLASVLMLVFLSEVRSGRPPRAETLDRALALEGGEPSWLAGTIPAIWWKGVDEHDRARERLQWMLDTAVRWGDEPMQHELMEHLAETETLAGRYDDAARWVARARELAAQLGAGVAAERWLQGTLDVYVGRLDRAWTAGRAGLTEAAASEDPWLRRISLQLCAFTALAEGRATEASALYGELDQALAAAGLAEPLASRYEPDWVEACVGVGDLATARVALARLTRRHEGLPRPWTTLAVARSRLLIAAAAGEESDGPVDELVEELVAARDATPVDVIPFDRARCLVVAGLAHRRARRKLAARDALLAAAAELDALGAPVFAARARAEADRTGARAASSRELTSSELRVAQLAAAGATNREIADALFISPKTVEANLARVYRKLGIGRRVELRSALDASQA